VYVDNDPMVLAHSRALKTGGNTAVIEADLRDPAAILNHSRTLELIDFRQPLAVLLVAVLHFIGEADDPYRLRLRLRPCSALLSGTLPRLSANVVAAPETAGGSLGFTVVCGALPSFIISGITG
jgi:S-adenosyl methyltransferase